MNETWTDYEKKVAKYISDKKDFGYFLKYKLEEFEELVNGRCDVFQLAKEVFEIESIVDNYENLEGFFENIANSGLTNLSYHHLLVDRHNLKITECEHWLQEEEWEETEGNDCDEIGLRRRKLKIFCYAVCGVNGTKILVHKSAKEFYKKYL